MITKHDAEVAFAQGKERGLAGAAASENPHKRLEHGTVNVLNAAWAQGHAAGLQHRSTA